MNFKKVTGVLARCGVKWWNELMSLQKVLFHPIAFDRLHCHLQILTLSLAPIRWKCNLSKAIGWNKTFCKDINTFYIRNYTNGEKKYDILFPVIYTKYNYFIINRKKKKKKFSFDRKVLRDITLLHILNRYSDYNYLNSQRKLLFNKLIKSSNRGDHQLTGLFIVLAIDCQIL